jgi:hypothetical protein
MKRAALTDTKNNLSLERQGFLRRASAPLPQKILIARPPAPSQGASVLEALLDERRDGR